MLEGDTIGKKKVDRARQLEGWKVAGCNLI